MRKNWIGTVVLVGVSVAVGMFLSQTWEQVHGQPVGFSMEAPQVAPQVVVQQPSELPKWFVDFTPSPQHWGKPEIRVVTVVDTETKRILVYHLNLTDGGLWFLSSRNIQPDLMVDQHNPRPPFPSDLILERQRLEQVKQNRQ